MKKFAVLVAAALAFTAVGGIALAAKQKVESKVTIEFDPGNSTDPYDPYGEATFSGKVKALNVKGKAKKKCEKKRTVRVRRVQPGIDPTYGTDKTNKEGEWVVPAPDAYEEGGQYYAEVDKKVKKKAKLICKADTSEPITVP